MQRPPEQSLSSSVEGAPLKKVLLPLLLELP